MLSSCDVSDALCKLNFPNGGFLAGITMWSPQRQDGPTKIVGPAYTVKYQPKDDAEPKHPTHYVCLSPICTPTRPSRASLTSSVSELTKPTDRFCSSRRSGVRVMPP
jgi:hypothetical protein